MINVTPAVKYHVFDTGFDGTLGNLLADEASRFNIAALFATIILVLG